MAALLALVSAICYGVSDFSGGLGSRRAAATTVVLVSNAVSLVLAVLAVELLPGSTYSGRDMLWGVAGGVLGLLGVVLLYRGLAIGPMSVVAPLTAVLSALVPLAAGVIAGERPGTMAVIGVALPAMLLLAREPSRPAAAVLSRGALASALCAGLGFGGFFVLLAQTGPGGGAWPLVAQRAASVALLLGISLVAALRQGGSVPVPGGRVLALAAVAGITDFAANLAYVIATHHGLFALVAVITSLYPASTLLLARGVLGERLARQQSAGLAIAAVAVALIALH